jgi:hypothetical protein
MCEVSTHGTGGDFARPAGEEGHAVPAFPQVTLHAAQFAHAGVLMLANAVA